VLRSRWSLLTPLLIRLAVSVVALGVVALVATLLFGS
jgi:hypothetical protein